MEKALKKTLALCVLFMMIAGALFAGAQQESGEEAEDMEGPIELRMAWWGNDARHAKYNQILDLYEEQNPRVTIEREFSGWGGYWEKLATQTAAGNAPDIISMHLNSVVDYASRGALVDLTPYVESGEIDLSEFTEGSKRAGQVDGKTYMVALGLSPRMMVFNPSMFDDAGAAIPVPGWTFDDWSEAVRTISSRLGEGYYGAEDQGWHDNFFFVYLGQRGKRLWEDDGLGFNKDDLRDWWQMWEDLRQAGALPSPDETVEISNLPWEDHPLSHGRMATTVVPGNQFAIFQEYSEDELDLIDLPDETDEDLARAYNYVSGKFLAIYSGSDHKDQVADFISWFANEPEPTLIYEGENGIPASTEMQEVLRPNLSAADQKLYTYYNTVADFVEPAPSTGPHGSELIATFERVYEELMFGRMTVDEAVDFFFSEADFVIN